MQEVVKEKALTARNKNGTERGSEKSIIFEGTKRYAFTCLNVIVIEQFFPIKNNPVNIEVDLFTKDFHGYHPIKLSQLLNHSFWY